ncbi:MAG: DUF5915 domain-containing protein, partial [Ardenticatenaceae bacterium]
IIAVTEALEAFDARGATLALEGLLEHLSNWYVRRSRHRFWKSGTDEDKEAAYATLYHVLVEMTKLMAPLTPFVTETIYQNLVRGVDTGAPSSVHHCDWPTADEATLDRLLLDRMQLAITVAGLGRAARAAADIKLRQPLARAWVHVGTEREREALSEVAAILTDELNVKVLEIVLEAGGLVQYRLLPNNRLLGPRFGSRFLRVRAALAALDQAEAAATLQQQGKLVLAVDGEAVTLAADEVLVQTESRGGLATVSDQGITVAVDTALTPDLLHEGHARDLVRAINALRRAAGLELDERIYVTYQAAGTTADAFGKYTDYIKRETLALDLAPGDVSTSLVQDTLE